MILSAVPARYRTLGRRVFLVGLVIVATLAGLEFASSIVIAVRGRAQHNEQLARLDATGARTQRPMANTSAFTLNLTWGFGHRRGFSAAEYFTVMGSPYHYPLSQDEFAKRVDGLPANNWGFQADRDYPFAPPADTDVVAIFGGSAASFFYAMVRRELEQGLAKILRKNVVVLNFALAAGKQPQQVQILTFFAAIGQRFDLILNIDGINELAHPPRNAKADVATAYPFVGVTGAAITQQQVPLALAEYVVSARDLAAITGRLQSVVRWNHAAFNSSFLDLVAVSVFRVAERKHQATLEQIQDAHRAAHNQEAVHLPHFSRLFETDDPIEQGIRTWMVSSRLIATIARVIGADYYEFVQPWQYLSRKPFSAPERVIAFTPSVEELARPYPRLVRQVDTLAAEGIRIYSLVNIYDEIREPIYVDSCCHVNVLGNRLMAEAVMARIREAKRRRRPATRKLAWMHVHPESVLARKMGVA